MYGMVCRTWITGNFCRTSASYILTMPEATLSHVGTEPAMSFRIGCMTRAFQLILPTAPGVSNEGGSSPLLALAPLFLGPEFQLGARWNRLVKAVKTRKKRGKTGKKWARYGLKRVKEGS